jgi:hypothetical protein
MDPADLEALVHRELKRLPTPQAPRTLLPRVLAASERQMRRPWYERPWLAWPRVWQALSGIALVALCAGFVVSAPVLDATGAGLARAVGDAAGRAGALVEIVVASMRVAGTVWRAVVEPVAVWLVVLIAVMCVGGAVCGAALARLAADGRSLR